MTKALKIVLTACLFAIPIGLVVGFSNSWSNKKPISCVGSSGVKPFVENLASQYMKDHKNVDITVEAGGSGFGIEQIAKGYANIGDASKDPYSAVRDGFREEWKKNKIKTVTIGWEAICMVYIPPKNLGLSTDQLNSLLTINDVGATIGDVANFMRIFSGIDEGITWDDTSVSSNSMWHFVNESNLSRPLDEHQKVLLRNTNIIPYVRSGGSLTSGTASSFVGGTNTNFSAANDLSANQQRAFSVGNYGTSFGLQQTDEANSRAWDRFSKDDRSGSIVYLSSGFVDQENNLSLIKKKGYGIITYKNHSYNTNSIDSANGYNWFRPLNTMVALKNENDSNEIAFVDYLLENSGDVYGCKKLEPDEIEEMFPGYIEDASLIWQSDIELSMLPGGPNSIHSGLAWGTEDEWPSLWNFAPRPLHIS